MVTKLSPEGLKLGNLMASTSGKGSTTTIFAPWRCAQNRCWPSWPAATKTATYFPPGCGRIFSIESPKGSFNYVRATTFQASGSLISRTNESSSSLEADHRMPVEPKQEHSSESSSRWTAPKLLVERSANLPRMVTASRLPSGDNAASDGSCFRRNAEQVVWSGASRVPEPSLESAAIWPDSATAIGQARWPSLTSVSVEIAIMRISSYLPSPSVASIADIGILRVDRRPPRSQQI